MWHQLLSKVHITQQLAFDTCNVEQRAQITLPLTFESACKTDQIIRDLSTKSAKQLDQIRHCVPDQFTKDEHLKAAYYDLPLIDTTLDRWNNLLEIQTECTVRWLQNKFETAASKSNWNPDIWFDAQNERNSASTSGVCDGDHWFKFVDTLDIGPYISHPWGPMLTALIAKEIIHYIDGEKDGNNAIHILDVGCGVGEFGDKLNELNTDKIKIDIDGIDRSVNSLHRIQSDDIYRCIMNMDLCDEMNNEQVYDIIVSADCLQISYGNDYSPGPKAVQDLMDLVKPNGYFLIVTTLQSVGTYKVVCIFDEILKNKWKEHGFECIADLTVRGFGDFTVQYNDEHEQNSIENNISFVKLMQRVTVS